MRHPVRIDSATSHPVAKLPCPAYAMIRFEI